MYSKLLEKVVNQHLILLTDGQVGYIPGYCSQFALIKLVDDTNIGINNSCITISVVFDLCKSLYTENHKILFTKLHKLNFNEEIIFK